METTSERYLSLTEAGMLVEGRPIGQSTIQRWARVGCGGVVLRTKTIGGRKFTTEAWLKAFLTAVENLIGT